MQACSHENFLIFQDSAQKAPAGQNPRPYGSAHRQTTAPHRRIPVFGLSLIHIWLTRVISRLGYLAAILVFAADFFLSVWTEGGMQLSGIWPVLTNFPVMLGHLMHALTLSISIVVVAVPEGLPMMITVVLSSNMLRMMRDHVLVLSLIHI